MNYIIKTTKFTDDTEVKEKISAALEGYSLYYRIDLLYELIQNIEDNLSFSMGLEEFSVEIKDEKQCNQIRDFLEEKFEEYTTELNIDIIVDFFTLAQNMCKEDNECDQKKCKYSYLCSSDFRFPNIDLKQLREELKKIYKK